MLPRALLNLLTVYSTSKQIQIKSTCLAVTYLILVVTVWVAYLGSLQLDVRKVYQKSCPAQGAIVTKVKGILSTASLPDSAFQVPDPEIYKRVWDVSDTIVPAYGGDGQDGGFVAFTNLLITPNQSRGVCSDGGKTAQKCQRDEDCPRGERGANGVFTGGCDHASGTCLLSGWCPTERTTSPLKGHTALLSGVENFTIMLKNSVEFPDCDTNHLHKRRNIPENITKKYLSACIYDEEEDSLCPIFRLGDIVRWSGQNFSEVAMTGGVFRVEVRWNCDFDWGFSDDPCFPTYHFSRIDVSGTRMISPGWNFRMAVYHEENRRTLQKVYGLKFLVTIAGEGRKFDILTLILTLGATVGLFALAPLVCDHLFQVLCLLKKLGPCARLFGDYSMSNKFQPVKEEEGTTEMMEFAMKVEYVYTNDLVMSRDSSENNSYRMGNN